MDKPNPGQGSAALKDPEEIDETDAPEEVEEGAEKKDAKDPLKSQKDHEPGADHPRFKQVYGDMKRYERALEEKEKDIEAIRAHNRRMESKLDEMEKGKADRVAAPAPDPVTDPDGYKKWHEHEMSKKDKEHAEKLQKERLSTQIEVQSELHDDYDAMVALADREMARDAKVQKEIWSSPNPPKAAYQYGKKKMEESKKQEESEQDRKKRLEQGAVESAGGGFTPPAKDENPISDDERRVIRNLFPDVPYKEAEKKYMAQRKHFGR